jgi:hypothetical protein
VLLPLSLLVLAVPAAFAYAGAAFLRGACVGSRPYGFAVSAFSFFVMLAAYASSLYAIGCVINLLPEMYKFGSSATDVSRSTVRLWALLTSSCLVVSWLLCRSANPLSRASVFARGTIGVVVCTSAVFIPFLLSPCAAYRA